MISQEILTVEAFGTSYSQHRAEPELVEDKELSEYPLVCPQCDYYATGRLMLQLATAS